MRWCERVFWGWFCNLEICGGIEVVVVDDADDDDDDNDEEVRDDVDVDDDDDDDEVGGGFFFLVGLELMVFFGFLVLVLPMSFSL